MAQDRIKPSPVSLEQINLRGLSLDYIKETGANFVNHKILPDLGGWNQQSRRWVRVMQEVYLPGLNWARYDALPEKEKNRYESLVIESDEPPLPIVRLEDL